MNRFNVYGFHIFKFHFNSQANINTLIKTADYMMRSKSISRGAEKTASLVIRFAAHNLKRTINLFYQYHAHHLVWEGHFAE